MTLSAPIKVLAVDDEPLARKGLRRLVERHPGCALAGECADGPAAVQAIVELRPDVLLLDVQMPELDGFGVLRAVHASGARLPVVVFITAFDDYALEAFRVHALDYLVKPFTDERFHEALGRACAEVRASAEGELARRLLALAGANLAPPPAPRLVVRSGERVLVIDPGELEWVQADSYYARLHVRGREHLLRESLTSLEGRLDPARFVRVHRSAIINLAFVREVDRAQVLLTTGARVPLARDRFRALVAHIERR